MSDTPEPVEQAPRCIHLSCKSMVVYGEAFEMDPEYQDGVTDFWCVCTSRSMGPDGRHVSMEVCRNRERSCYKEY